MARVSLSGQPVRLQEAAQVRRVGLIALATDLTTERDFAAFLPPGKVAVHTTRVAFENPTTPDNLRKMSPQLTEAASMLLPGLKLDAICYSCTAASVVIGDDAVAAAIGQSRAGVPVVTPTRAVCQAFDSLGINRISILTPYLVETSAPMAEYFEAKGYGIARFECLGMEDDRDMALVSRETIIEAARQALAPGSEALFISCTALPAAGLVPDLEELLGVPVITSNLASAWALLSLTGAGSSGRGCGRLFDCPLMPEDWKLSS